MNKTIIIGKVGMDPEIKNLNPETKMAVANVAVNEKWTDKSGNKQESTEWFRCIIWNNLAGIVEKYVKKGSKVCFEGKMRTRKYTDKDGIERYQTELQVDQIELLGTPDKF